MPSTLAWSQAVPDGRSRTWGRYCREMRALDEAMEELTLDRALLVTLDEERNLTRSSGLVSILPAWRFALDPRKHG